MSTCRLDSASLCEDVVRMCTDLNPNFFEDTAIENYVAHRLE